MAATSAERTYAFDAANLRRTDLFCALRGPRSRSDRYPPLSVGEKLLQGGAFRSGVCARLHEIGESRFQFPQISQPRADACEMALANRADFVAGLGRIARKTEQRPDIADRKAKVTAAPNETEPRNRPVIIEPPAARAAICGRDDPLAFIVADGLDSDPAQIGRLTDWPQFSPCSCSGYRSQDTPMNLGGQTEARSPGHFWAAPILGIASLLAVASASCCILPIGLSIIGLGGTWLTVLGPFVAYRSLILLGVGAVLIAVWAHLIVRRSGCARRRRTVLTLAAICSAVYLAAISAPLWERGVVRVMLSYWSV